jgi:hypothetical protein
MLSPTGGTEGGTLGYHPGDGENIAEVGVVLVQ